MFVRNIDVSLKIVLSGIQRCFDFSPECSCSFNTQFFCVHVFSTLNTSRPTRMAKIDGWMKTVIGHMIFIFERNKTICPGKF